MLTLGIDIGSTTSKCVLLEDGSKIIDTSLIVAGIGTDGAEKCLGKILEANHLCREDISFMIATGYGRKNFAEADGELSELSCHAKGVHFTNSNVRTIIDIGGQDAKVIRLNAKGILENFLMNDKCAAGTGRFLDVMSNILQVPIAELERQARSAKNPAKISSTCTVFAESEVISQLSQGAEIENVIAGICNSVAIRVASLAKRIGVKEEVFMSGGVAQNGGVRDALERELGVSIQYSEYSQLMGAIGAAIYAFEKRR
ncbi:MAG: acyl-CoA dehydratase activase [Mobilitalea sp.]